MIVARKLDQQLATSEAAGQPNGTHRGLGTGIHQADTIDRIDRVDDQLGQLIFTRRGSTVAGATIQCRLQGSHHGGMPVTQDHRSPGTDVVDIAIAVDVLQPAALAALNDDWRAPHRTEGACRAVDAARHQLLGTGEELFTFTTVHVEAHGRRIDLVTPAAARLPAYWLWYQRATSRAQ